MTFPSERQFRSWWKGKRDRRNMSKRFKTCPIARYLQAHGMPEAEVGQFGWRRDTNRAWVYLPLWAVRAIREWDE